MVRLLGHAEARGRLNLPAAVQEPDRHRAGSAVVPEKVTLASAPLAVLRNEIKANYSAGLAARFIRADTGHYVG